MPNGDIGGSKGLPRIVDRRRYIQGPKNYQNSHIRTVSPWRPPPDHRANGEGEGDPESKDRRTSSLPNITPPLPGGRVDADDGEGT